MQTETLKLTLVVLQHQKKTVKVSLNICYLWINAQECKLYEKIENVFQFLCQKRQDFSLSHIILSDESLFTTYDYVMSPCAQ